MIIIFTAVIIFFLVHVLIIITPYFHHHHHQHNTMILMFFLYLTIMAGSCSTAYIHSFTLLIAVVIRVFIDRVVSASTLMDNNVVTSFVVSCVFIAVRVEFVCI
jgi:hypothetical protein